MKHPPQTKAPAVKMKIKKLLDDHAVSHSGHNHMVIIADFKKLFYVILLLTDPIVLLSAMIRHFAGMNWPFTGSIYLLFALSTVVFFYVA